MGGELIAGACGNFRKKMFPADSVGDLASETPPVRGYAIVKEGRDVVR